MTGTHIYVIMERQYRQFYHTTKMLHNSLGISPFALRSAAERTATDMIIPKPKNTQYTEGTLQFKKLSVFCEHHEDHFTENYIHMFVDIAIEFVKSSESNMRICQNTQLQNGAYTVEVDSNIHIAYGDQDGLRNALATLIQILNEDTQGFYCKKQTITDYPDSQFRSVMIDLARGLPDFARLTEDIKRLSLAKCNVLHFHLMDGMGICYESAVYEGEDIRGTKRYSIDTMRELVKYCEDLGISVIPEIEIPAHAAYLLHRHPEFLCECDIENQSKWDVCAGNEKVYEFYERLIDEICEIFPGQYIHVGGDEMYFSDLPDLHRACHWNICKVCAKRMEEENITEFNELYCYMMNRINEKVKSCGKTTIIWNDMTDIAKDLPLSKDIIIEYWRTANENRGPRKGCSFDLFLKKGFKVINANFETSYLDLEAYANPEKTASYSYKAYPANDDDTNIIGAEACAWEYGNPACGYYLASFSPAAILLLDKMWNTDDRVYNKEYRASMTKLILGVQTPCHYDMFEIFGSIMPPRTADTATYVTIQNELTDRETLEKHSHVLKGITETYSRNYLNHVQEIIKKELTI